MKEVMAVECLHTDTDQTVYSLTSILHYDSNTFFFTDYNNISLDHKYKLFVMTNWFKGPSAVIVW
jgi:hypothetical protein